MATKSFQNADSTYYDMPWFLDHEKILWFEMESETQNPFLRNGGKVTNISWSKNFKHEGQKHPSFCVTTQKPKSSQRGRVDNTFVVREDRNTSGDTWSKDEDDTPASNLDAEFWAAHKRSTKGGDGKWFKKAWKSLEEDDGSSDDEEDRPAAKPAGKPAGNKKRKIKDTRTARPTTGAKVPRLAPPIPAEEVKKNLGSQLSAAESGSEGEDPNAPPPSPQGQATTTG
jgi:hypothetical protein